MPAQLDALDYQRVEEIHRSSGGSVCIARKRSTGERVILKERHAAELGRGRDIAHELEMYEQLPQHPNLVRCLGAFWKGGSGESARSGRPSRGTMLSMVFEYAAGGDLHAALQGQRRSGRYLSERQVLQWFVPIVAGVQHLH